MDQGLAVLAINANDIAAYPQDGPEHMPAFAEQNGWSFPYLLDETQEVARTFRAACTPDLFLFDRDRKLAYRGQFDASRPGNNRPVTGDDLDRAVQAVLAGQPVPGDQVPSVGCNIKWKPGNEPDYGPREPPASGSRGKGARVILGTPTPLVSSRDAAGIGITRCMVM
ncbi:ahpC/TSA family protein [Mycobacterium xenopi 3993]|nr:ahpC/TSA family protein [Mycobacterium xenopi 3993]